MKNNVVKEIDFCDNNYERINSILDNSDDKIRINIWLQELNYNNRKELDVINDKNNVILKVAISENDIYEISLQKYLYYENLLDLFVYDIKNSNLSPFEKLICAHTIVKNFKSFLNEPYGTSYHLSRNLYEILDNDYIVCAGYDNLYDALLYRLGITNTKEVRIYIEENCVIEPHQRRMLYIKDDKYNIEGVYLSDSTWDNDETFEHDYFTHLVLTEEEIECEDYNYEKNWNIVFSVKSLEDLRKLLQDERYFIVTCNILEKVLPQQYDYLKEIYLVNDYEYQKFIKTDLFQNFSVDLFNLINKYFKNKIDYKTILDAYREVDMFIYNDKDIVERMYLVRKNDNLQEYEKCFKKKC